jgi:hypothetical protein
MGGVKVRFLRLRWAERIAMSANDHAGFRCDGADLRPVRMAVPLPCFLQPPNRGRQTTAALSG